MRQGLADAGVGPHGGGDQEAVARVGQQRLAGGEVGLASGSVGVGEPRPHVELGRPDERRIGDVDVVDDAHVPPRRHRPLPRTRRATPTSGIVGS